MALEKKKVGEDWTDSDENFKTSGTLDSGDQTIIGDADVSGTITGAIVMQGAEQVLDTSDLIPGTILNEVEIVNAGPSVPTSPFAGMFWYDTAANFLKVRNEANNAWLSVWDIANNKPVVTNLEDEITGVMIAPAVAGTGLVQDGSGNLDVSELTVSEIASGEGLINVSANDADPGFLNGKLTAGGSIKLTEGSDGADEILTVGIEFRGAAAYLNTAGSVAISDGSANVVEWTNLVYDTNSFFDLGGANPEIITIPANVNHVQFTGQVGVVSAASVNGYFIAKLLKGGSNYILQATPRHWISRTGGFEFAFISPVIAVSESDTFGFQVSWVDSAGSDSSDLKGSNNGNATFLGVAVLG